jgi:hypothetical protein
MTRFRDTRVTLTQGQIGELTSLMQAARTSVQVGVTAIYATAAEHPGVMADEDLEKLHDAMAVHDAVIRLLGQFTYRSDED